MSTEDVREWIPDRNTFAARLALLRRQLKWNGKEAALACDLAQGSWREWELTGRLPRDYEGVCKQIAQRTGCDLIWLMTGSPSKRGPSDAQPGDGYFDGFLPALAIAA